MPHLVNFIVHLQEEWGGPLDSNQAGQTIHRAYWTRSAGGAHSKLNSWAALEKWCAKARCQCGQRNCQLEAESSRWMTNQSWDSATTVGMALSHFSFWPWMRQGHKLVMGIGNLTKQRPLERTCQGSVRNSTIEPVMAHLLKQWGKRWLERGRLRAIWVHTLIESHWEQLGSSVAVSMCMRPRQTTHISWSSGDSMGPMQVIQSLKLILA